MAIAATTPITDT